MLDYLKINPEMATVQNIYSNAFLTASKWFFIFPLWHTFGTQNPTLSGTLLENPTLCGTEICSVKREPRRPSICVLQLMGATPHGFYVPDFGKIGLKIGGISRFIFSLLKITNLPELLISLLRPCKPRTKIATFTAPGVEPFWPHFFLTAGSKVMFLPLPYIRNPNYLKVM